MDLKQLRALLTVAETGSVTRAAELLHLVQPAVSRQLALLEKELDAPLFHRGRHGMVLTEQGETLCGYARRALLELDRARAEIAGKSHGIGGLVTLGLLPSTCDLLSGPLVTALAQAYPGIRLRIATAYAGTLTQWLASGEVDAALLYGAPRTPDIQITPLIDESLWVLGPASAKLRPNRPKSLKSLIGKPMILPSAPHGIRTLVDQACALAKIELTITAETNVMSVQKSLAIEGHGLTILPAIAIADDLARKTVSAAPLCDPVINRTIVLALPTTRVIGRHVHAAVDLLIQCMENATKRGDWFGARWVYAHGPSQREGAAA